MPWKVVKKGSGPKPFKVVKSDTGEVVYQHATKPAAEAQVKALYANAEKEDMND